jgi:hypothetical protein
MATGTAGDQARLQPRQVVNTWRATINFNDPGIGTGVAKVTLPAGAFILRVLCEIQTVFNAVTTNLLTLGTVAAAYNNLFTSGDVNAGVAGVYDITRGLGTALTRAGDVTIYAMYTQTGGAATTGIANIVVEFEGNTG